MQVGMLEFDRAVQRNTITTMQAAILPLELPAVTGVTVGRSYMTGGDPNVPIGGDWFAFVRVSEDRLGIAIGDVVGHGLPAVTAMTEYGHALRAIAIESPDPAMVMERLREVARAYSADAFSSCIYGVLDAFEGTWTYTSAGHPPPLLVRDGVVQPVEPKPHGPFLGVAHRPEYRSSVEVLKTGDLVALYTDGLVEVPGESIYDGIDRLGQRLARLAPTDLDAECVRVIYDLVGTAPRDDVALVMARYDGAH
jgi:serine phosphatase RsbU (regulator of sigma subunit)